jgi:MFS family permease
MSSAMFSVSGVLLVLERTGSPTLAGVTAAAATLPGSLSGPLLGAWLDVARRRRVLIVVDQVTSATALLGILALAGHGPGWTLPAVAVLYSVTRPFSSGTFFTALIEIAGPELLDSASAVEASSLNLSFVVGPALAGLLAGTAGAALAVVVQAGAALVVATLVAVNPVFEARPPEQAGSMAHALRQGLRALLVNPELRAVGAGSALANFGWGLMMVGFPVYASGQLHAGQHAGGYLWAAVATGSILGTFGLPGRASLRRVAGSYAVLAISALAWLLAHTIVVGLVLVTLTGFLEGPAYSGTVALRLRHSPPAVRNQVIITLSSVSLGAAALGSFTGGALHRIGPCVLVFTAVNLVAALATGSGLGRRALGKGLR